MYCMVHNIEKWQQLRSNTLKRLVIYGYGENDYIFILVMGLCIFL